MNSSSEIRSHVCGVWAAAAAAAGAVAAAAAEAGGAGGAAAAAAAAAAVPRGFGVRGGVRARAAAPCRSSLFALLRTHSSFVQCPWQYPV